MKNLFYLSFIFTVAVTNVYSQKTVEKTEYWDYWETQKKKVWHELGDGTWHGDVKEYREDGTLRVHTIMHYHKVKSKTWYFQDGSIMLKINNNDEGVKNGIQELYEFTNGIRFLKAWANISNDVVKEYKCFYKKDVLKFTYTFDGSESIFKRFNEDDSVAYEIKTKEGIISDINNFYGITIKNNRIEKVAINLVTLEIKDSKYYTMLNYPNEEKKYAYYKIPENQIFQLKSVFNYSDAYFTIDFELDLYLQIVKNDSYSFSLVLNNSDYDDEGYNKYNVSINALKYYFSNLTLDGLYRSYEDYSENCFDIFYVNGEETWKKNYYNDGTLKNYAHGDTLLEYNESGKLYKETIGDSFKVFDIEGKVIDSKEIRDNYNTILEEYNKIKAEYNTINDATNEIIINDFCIDISSGQYTNQSQCYTSDNEYIGEALKILHLDYIKAWKALIPEYEKLNSVENSLQWRSNTQFLEKIDVLKGYVDFYSKNLSLIKEFTIAIDKFKEILKSPDVKKVNKSLKKTSTSNEIKLIIGI